MILDSKDNKMRYGRVLPGIRGASPFEGGFTLIETLVAISVLLLALTATLYVAAKSISSAGVARDQITAFYLAEEAVEYVRNTRDNNSLAGASWLSGLSSCIGANCYIDAPNNTVSSCVGDCPLMLLSSSGIYNHQIGDATIFRREVQINEVASGREATLDVTIVWQRALIPRTFTIREHIFNWK